MRTRSVVLVRLIFPIRLRFENVWRSVRLPFRTVCSFHSLSRVCCRSISVGGSFVGCHFLTRLSAKLFGLYSSTYRGISDRENRTMHDLYAVSLLNALATGVFSVWFIRCVQYISFLNIYLLVILSILISRSVIACTHSLIHCV